jgi:hypothetical protein
MEDRRGRWLTLLQEERDRRAAANAETFDRDAAMEQLSDELEEMAGRFAALAHLHPLDVSDMSIAEKLACRCFLPEDLRPVGLGTVDEIWAEYEARKVIPPRRDRALHHI